MLKVICVLGCWGCMVAAGYWYDLKAIGIMAVACICTSGLTVLLEEKNDD